MIKDFQLPDLGEGIHEATILSLAVTTGQEIKEGDPLMEVETDKAAVEIPSPVTGTVTEILVTVGQMVTVGTVLMRFNSQSREKASPQPAPIPETPEVTAATRRPPVPASPSTRRLAREKGVNLREVTASGAGGVVTRDDVLRFLQTGANTSTPELPPTPPTPTPQNTYPSSDPTLPPSPPPDTASIPDYGKWGAIRREPLQSVRRTTARNMARSWAEIPHVFCQDDVDITRLEAFRQRHKDEIKALGGRLTITVFALKAAATALKRYPQFNASLDLQRQEIIFKEYCHIGVAVDSPQGLVVPVIRDVDRKSIKELAVEMEALATKVRNKKHDLNDLQGGSFTISNAGALGGHRFSAIINHPQVAILGMGQSRKQPVVVAENGREEIAIRQMMPLLLCFDHRIADGADAIRFLRLVLETLTDPDEMLMTMI